MIKLSINYMNKLQIRQPVTIIANGNFPCHKIPLDILKKSNTIIACDGAADKLIKNNYSPDVIIGDMDSISNNKIHLNKIIEEKDQTDNDLRKAIKYTINNNIHKIDIIGATGLREDHTIGNLITILLLY